MTVMLQQPFFQITLPLLFGLWLASWYSGKRFEDLRQEINRRLETIEKRLDAIEANLKNVERKLDALELKAWR
jgi:hypothetical protein